jgi:hypothetical protein
VASSILFVATTAFSENEEINLYVFKNGAVFREMGRTNGHDASSAYVGTNGSTIVQLNKGEYLDIRVKQDSGGALALLSDQIYTHASITQLPDLTVIGVNGYNKTPTVQRLTSGSGTYTTPNSVKYLKVKMVGGGAGGSGSGTGAGTGGSGGSTTFGTSLLTCTGGGVGSVGNNTATTGGTATVNSPATTLVALSGGSGGGGDSTAQGDGAIGGSSPFGGQGPGGSGGSGAANSGVAAIANTGSGGGGGGAVAVATGLGCGGAAGGYIEAIIDMPSASYSYAVGGGGAGGAAGTSGYAGGAGGSGIIIVEEYYS